MRPDQFQVGVAAEQRDQSVGVGVVVAHVARVHQHHEVCVGNGVVHTGILGQIDLKPLDIGVQFDTLQPEFDEVPDVLLDRFALGVERAEPD